MTTLWIDTETYSDRDLTAIGAYRYHETSEVMLVTYGIDNDPPQVWRVVESEPEPYELMRAIEDSAVPVFAQNTQFDRLALYRLSIDIPINRWHDTLIRGSTIGLPAQLSALSTRLGLSEEKAKIGTGRKLINLFCMPQFHTARRVWWHERPKEWESFVAYALRDIDAMRAVAKRIGKRHTLRHAERRLWELDQAINARGLPIDWRVARAGVKLAQHCKRVGDAAIMKHTCNALTTTGQTKRLRDWLARHNVKADNVDKHTVSEMLSRPELTHVHSALEARLIYNRASPKKYSTMLTHLSDDGRVRGAYRFHKAHTGRWAGAGIQPHNFTRPPKNVNAAQLADTLRDSEGDPDYPRIKDLLADGLTLPDLLAYAVRGAITAPPGRQIIVADYPQIEARMTHWLARNSAMVEAFRDPDQDPYVVAAQRIGSAADRFLGKITTLGCGYQMGGPKFQTTCQLVHGITMSPERADAIIVAWRESNGPVVDLWAYLQQRLKDTLRLTQGPLLDVPIQYNPLRCRPLRKGTVDVTVPLPSGRVLYYANARVRSRHADIVETHDPAKAGELLALIEERCLLNDWSVDWYMSRQVVSYQSEFSRVGLYGGRQLENWVQALCRDILAEALLEVDMMLPPGADIIGHTHDEIIVEANEDATTSASAVIREAMMRNPPWALDLPLGEPEITVGQRYSK